MKNYVFAAILAATAAAPAFAQEEATSPFTVSGSVGLVTDYRFRGVSQTDQGMAVQGGFSVSHESGVYVGTWGSNLAGWGAFGGSNMELDIYAGYKTAVGAATIDVGATYYFYPSGLDNTQFIEPYVKVGTALGPVSATVGVAYAPEQEALGRWYFNDVSYAAGTPDAPGAKSDNLYVWGDLAGGVPNTPLTLKGHLGYSKGNSGLGPNGTSIAPTGKYWDWSLGADLALGPVVLGISYVDTDISDAERQYIAGSFLNYRDGGNIAGSTVVGSITVAF
ncbi:MAG: hypothetical protein J0G94_16725 [Sphingomonadales bacterium]|nr:hypothetical protein [Sphingomonadales bacterium]